MGYNMFLVDWCSGKVDLVDPEEKLVANVGWDQSYKGMVIQRGADGEYKVLNERLNLLEKLEKLGNFKYFLQALNVSIALCFVRVMRFMLVFALIMASRHANWQGCSFTSSPHFVHHLNCCALTGHRIEQVPDRSQWSRFWPWKTVWNYLHSCYKPIFPNPLWICYQ